jgi:paraquat-inducible protein B
MSKKANPTTIGLFIVAGLALGIVGLLLFSSSRLFASTMRCIVYFDSSLNGLNEGAPVKFRGVTIGQVVRVMIRYNQATNDMSMPVIIELRDDLIRARWSGESALRNVDDLQRVIEAGLRASLETESLVTGVLFVSLEMVMDSTPPLFRQLTPKYPEIPSRPTDIQQLLHNLARLDIAGSTERLNSLITRVETSLSGLKLDEISDGVTGLVHSLDRVVTAPALTNSLASLQVTLEQYRLLAEKLHSRVDPLADSVTDTLAEAGSALTQVRSGVQNLRDLLAPDSSLRNELTIALEQLAAAAQSIAGLAEQLERHPNALITGRGTTTK